MTSKTKGKTFDINSFERLVEVADSENIDRLSKDLFLWLSIVVRMKEKFPELKQMGFVWTDDGKMDIKNLELTDKNTGERRVVKITPKGK